MKHALVLPLLLALASCGTGRGVSTARVEVPMAVQAAPLTVVPGSTVALGKVFPVINGQVVHEGSVECVGIAPVTYVPSPARVTEIRAWTERALRWDVQHGVLVSPLGVDEALRLLQYLPAIRFYDRPTYNYSRWPDGTWVWACAQGFSGFDGPKIAADDPARTEKLCVHESVNFYIGLIGRADLWDGIYVTGIVDAVGLQLMGGWRVAAGAAPPSAVKDLAHIALGAANDTPDLCLTQPAFTEGEDVLYVSERKVRDARPLAAGVPGTDWVDESRDVAPTPAVRDGSDDGWRRVKSSRYHIVGDPLRVELVDAGGRSGRDRGRRGSFAYATEPHRDGVPHVPGTRGCFQISEPVVHLDPVEMVDVFPVAERTDERLEDDPVHGFSTPALCGVDGCLQVSGATVCAYRDASNNGASRWGVSPHAAEIGDGVVPAAIHDRQPSLREKFFGGKFDVSHVSLLSRGSVVRLGVDVSASPRAAFILPNAQPNATENAVGAQVTGGWRVTP